MKKNNKKGFTIVELVIVIAVIAILSAVLIPTFSNITDKAKESAALQDARNALTSVIAEEGENFGGNYFIKSGNYWFEVVNSQLKDKKIADQTITNAEKVFAKAEQNHDNNGTADGGTIETTIIEDLNANVVVYKVANA